MADGERDDHCPCCGQRTRPDPGYTLLRIQARGTSFTAVRPGAFESPIRYGNGNIHWPPGWSDQDRRAWRVMMDEPGAEWDPGESQT